MKVCAGSKNHGSEQRNYGRNKEIEEGEKDPISREDQMVGATDKDQVAVIELGKDIVRATLPIVETRSGKKIEYQDEEARKSGR